MSVVTFQTDQPLTVPADAYNEDGLAVLIATGGRYGGEWVVNICYGPGSNPTIIGSVHTAATPDPDVAAETAWAWMAQECGRLGLKVVHTEAGRYRNPNKASKPAKLEHVNTGLEGSNANMVQSTGLAGRSVMPQDYVPYYAEIMNDIREQVADGRLQPGDRLPSTRDLATQYRRGASTVREAVTRLIEEGVLRGHRGDGVFVADKRPD